MPKKSKRETHVHGNVEKLTQIDNVEGNVIIHSPSTPSAAELLKKGIQYMNVRAYDDAVKAFEESIKVQPSSQAYYYLALALLRGKRPKLLTLTQAETIEQKLLSASQLGGKQAHYYYLWALVKVDFYVANGFLVRPPSFEELLNMAENFPINPAAIIEMLQHTNVENSHLAARMQMRLRSE